MVMVSLAGWRRAGQRLERLAWAGLAAAGMVLPSRAADGPASITAAGWTNEQAVLASQGSHTGLVALTWAPVDQAAAYEVWRGASNHQASALQVAEVASNAWDDTTVADGVRYCYWIRARTLQGVVPVGTGGVTRGYGGLPPPGMVAASDGTLTNAILVTWSAVSNALGYEVWRQTTNDGDRAACLAATAGTAFEDASAAEVTLYLYWIVATNRLCRSAASFYDTGFRQLPAPRRVKASDDTYTDRVHVAWGMMSNAASYEIWRGAKDATDQAEKVGATESNAWDDVTAAPGVTYFYWVRAVTEVGLGAFSKPDKGRRKSLAAQLRPPGRVQASDGTFSDKVLVKWQAVSNATGYEVWRGEASNAPALLGASLTDSYEDTTAVTGVVYGYSVKATNAMAASAFSRPDKGHRGVPQPPPAPPAAVAASQGTVPAAVRVEWTASPDAKRYEIWRGFSSQVNEAQPVGAVAGRALVFNDATAAHGVRYTYWVRSVSGVITGAFSAACTGFRPLPPPAAPAASAGVFSDKIRLNWAGVTNAGLYEIWRATSNSFPNALRITSAASTSYDDVSALPGVRYFYWITARNAACPGMPSVAAVGYRPLPAPKEVAASDGAYPDRVQVTWKAVPYAMLYEVWRGATNSAVGARRVGVSAEPAFADRSAAPGTRYYYFVRAAGSAGPGPFSDSNQGHRMPRLPTRAIGGGVGPVMAAPTTLNATDGAHTDKVRLTWKAASGATGYEVWRGLTDQLNRAVRLGQTADLAFDDRTAVPGTEYTYWVRGFNGSGAGGYSAGTTGHRQLPAPGGIRVDGSVTDRVRLDWSGVAQAAQYEVWRNTSAQAASATLLATVSRTGFEDASVLPGVAYTYWVRARNALSVSPYSAAIPASRPLPPPAGLEASRGEHADRVRLAWRASEGATGYEVWRGLEPDVAAATRVATPSAAAYDDTTAVPGAAYTYWVRARASGGTSAYSAPAAGHRPLAAPAGVSASDGAYTDRIQVA
jgi:fibronectin type 3 domain-containing protein